MNISTWALLALSLFVTSARSQVRGPFPPADPESVGLSATSLEALDAVVQGFVDDDLTVGAELLVIKNRRTVLHAAHGWADRDSKQEWKPGSIVCIRSMTKPIVGTAIQMLIDEGKLALDDPVSKYLPEFDTPTHGAITIRNLLEHRSGLPLSSLVGTDYKSFKSVRDVAGLAAKADLHFKPDEQFNYSDDGTDTLAALVGVVAGMSTEQFIQQRLLDPLAMSDTVLVFGQDDPRRAKAVSAYAGSKGAWSRFWSPEEEPLFPYFLGSQSAYATCADYARLLCLWADGGMHDGKRLLSEQAIERGLAPRSEMMYPCGLTGLTTFYGQLWMVWSDTSGESPRRVAFGHGGSDGTMAWIWPEQDLIVVYFTQSRGGLTPLTLEGEIDYLLLGGPSRDVAAVDAAQLAPLVGQYWDEEDSYYWSIDAEEGKLTATLQGRTALSFVPDEADATWKAELAPQLKIRFDRTNIGPAAALIVSKPGSPEATLSRMNSKTEWPAPETLVANVVAAHHVSNVTNVIRREGTLEMASRSGTITNYIAADRGRSDIDLAGTKVRVVIRDGKVWMRRGDAPASEMTGTAAQAAIAEQAFVVFGDWIANGATVRVLREFDVDGQPSWMVHVALPGTHPCTMFVEKSTGRLIRQDRVADVPGAGALGLSTRFSDFETVGGALLPRVIESKYVAVLGTSRVSFEDQQVVEEADGLFDIDAP